MKRGIVGSVLRGCLLLALAGTAWAQQGRRPDAARAEVFFCETLDPGCRSNNSTFFIEELRDVYVFAAWPDLTGQHVQTVEFYLPDGHLYERKVQAFTFRRVPQRFPGGVRISAAAADRMVLKPVEEHLTISRGARTVITPLAVAGTFITQHRLLGTWTVRVRLENGAAATGQFELRSGPPR
jgi:hypothetical protein